MVGDYILKRLTMNSSGSSTMLPAIQPAGNIVEPLNTGFVGLWWEMCKMSPTPFGIRKSLLAIKPLERDTSTFNELQQLFL